ncbi:LysR family transcriptional regulator [Marinomonas sp. RS-M-Aa-14]|uniref:LysR family transcriptional regulator n=1 Tax=Marinomonas sp. RS-M-Aa-14 TaxID=3241169 RepID=UPI003AAF78F9
MEIAIPNLRHLRVFLAVAELKSITRASETIFLSQPAITQAIAKLEGLLGAALFERHSDGMHPTPSGEVWQKRVSRAINHIQNATLDIVKDNTPKERVQKNLVALISTTQLRSPDCRL